VFICLYTKNLAPHLNETQFEIFVLAHDVNFKKWICNGATTQICSTTHCAASNQIAQKGSTGWRHTRNAGRTRCAQNFGRGFAQMSSLYRRPPGAPALQTFNRQNEAFEYRKQLNDPSVRMFAFEQHGSNKGGACFVHNANLDKSAGYKMYLASPFDEFCHLNQSLPPSQKHYYELIPSGQPCRLYFDVEYYRDIEANAKIRGNENKLRQTFIKHIHDCLYDDYQIPASSSVIFG
jgi:hypothetical protein